MLAKAKTLKYNNIKISLSIKIIKDYFFQLK